MKTKKRPLFASLITVAFTSLANNASADVTKADNTNALNTGASYTSPSVVPTGSDLLIIDSNLANPRTAVLGGNVSVKGITASSANTLTVSNTNAATLTIGASGINSSGAGALTLNNVTSLGGNITMANTATGAITFGGALTLTANQTWALGSTLAVQNRININGGLTTGGNTLAISSASATQGILSLQNTTLGTEVTIGILGVVYANGGTVTINGINNTNNGFSVFSGTANIASMGNLTGASSIGKASAYVRSGTTLNFTGNSETSNKGFSRDNNNLDTTIKVTTTGQTLSMSGNLTSTTVSGGWVFGGAGNLSLSGNITNAATTTVTKQDAGTLTLSGASNAYTGQTTVTGGKFTVASTGNINTTSGVTIGTAATAATSEFNYNSSTALSPAVTFATTSTGGTLSGTGTITPAVTVTSGNTYTPGAKGAAGTQTLTGGVTFNSGSIFQWDIDISGASETGHDKVTNTGGLAGDGGAGAVFNVVLGTGAYTAPFWDSPRSWNDVFSVGNLASVFSSITGTGVIWDSGTSRGNVAGEGYFTMATNTLSWTAVPEPTSALAGLLITAGLLRRRRNA